MRQQADNVYLIWYQPGTGRPVQQSTPARTIGYIPSAQAEENYHLTQTGRTPRTVTSTKPPHNSGGQFRTVAIGEKARIYYNPPLPLVIEDRGHNLA